MELGSKSLKFLIDTNIVIPLEPTSSDDVEPLTAAAVKFDQMVRKAKHELYLHPAQEFDFRRDEDLTRRTYREILTGKYLQLPSPPTVTRDLERIIGAPREGTNDWVDNQLIVALCRHAIDYVVTEDKKLRNKARRLNLGDRVLTLPEAIRTAQVLFDEPPVPPSPVSKKMVHNLELSDPIFQACRNRDNAFDDHFAEWCRSHLDALVIEGSESGLAAVAVIDEEQEDRLGLHGQVLRILLMVISDLYAGFLYGELLLKALLSRAKSSGFDWLYSVYDWEHPDPNPLGWLHSEFGFEIHAKRTADGSHILLKKLTSSPQERLQFSPTEYFRRFGPIGFKTEDVPVFLVPIQAHHHRLLFPDAEPQEELLAGLHPFGNSIRKAYLSRAPIRRIKPGDILLFYKSEPEKGVTAAGVVEDTLVSDDPNAIAKFVSRRTVYSLADIAQLCKSDVLAILFQHSGTFREPIPYKTLVKRRALQAPPQAIQSIPKEALKWVQSQMEDELRY